MKLIRVIQSKIVKKDNKYQVQSEKGKNLGTYNTKEEAEERLKQVEMFKHMKKKSKLFTYDELNDWYEEELRKQGFPTDEELHKQYEEYVKKVEIENYNESHNFYKEPMSFDDFKKFKLHNFSLKNTGTKPEPRKWNLDNEWIDTDDDPIELPVDIQI